MFETQKNAKNNRKGDKQSKLEKLDLERVVYNMGREKPLSQKQTRKYGTKWEWDENQTELCPVQTTKS